MRREVVQSLLSLVVIVGGLSLTVWLTSSLSYDLDQINRDATIPSKNPRHVTGVCLLPVVLDENTQTKLPPGHPYEGRD